MDTNEGDVEMAEKNVLRALGICQGVFGLAPGSTMSERALLSPVSFLDFLQWVAPGGSGHLRSGWDALNGAGVTDSWRPGKRRAESRSVAAEVLRNDNLW